MARRSEGSWFWELFVEYLIAGLATALGEAIVVRLMKLFKRKKRKKRKESTDEEEE